MIKLASEKNLNKFLHPVVNLKGKKVAYPLEVKNNSRTFTCEKGVFGAKQFMIMDILGTLAIHGIYRNAYKREKIDFGNKIPKPNEKTVKQFSRQQMSRKILEYAAYKLESSCADIMPDDLTTDLYSTIKDVDPQIKNMKECVGFPFNDGILRKQLPFLRKYTSLNIRDMLVKTSNCMIKTYMPIRFFDGKKYENFPFNNYYISMPLFRLTETKEGDRAKNGDVLNRTYSVRFDTVLGYIFIQNIISIYTDLLPGKFYELSDYAQLFYRLLILPYYNDIKNPIGLDEIKKRLVLTSDSYGCRKTVKRIMDELQAEHFIDDPKEIKLNGKYAYSYVKRSWKDMNDGE